ncbi:MAG: FkbM family methyltransferase [Caldimonas sp.]
MATTTELSVDIGGKRYLIASDDNYLEGLRNGFEPDTVKLFKSASADSDTILDIGANIGCTALLFADIAKQVVAFEPSPTTFAFLQRNVRTSGHRNLQLKNFGLGEHAGEFTLTYAPSNRSGGFVSDQTKASQGHTVERIEIRETDEAIESLGGGKIDFIKIDVEGFEGHVLRGASRTLEAHRPTVCLELNHWCLNAFQRTSVPDFFDQLRSTFPILLAVHGQDYLNLHDESERYNVMYSHILFMKFQNIVGAFDEARLAAFRSSYRHHSPA